MRVIFRIALSSFEDRIEAPRSCNSELSSIDHYIFYGRVSYPLYIYALDRAFPRTKPFSSAMPLNAFVGL
jgi:hypothetical protein